MAPQIKLCGTTSLEDAELAASFDVWAIGFILWPQSKRAVDPAVAAGIARAMRAHEGNNSIWTESRMIFFLTQ